MSLISEYWKRLTGTVHPEDKTLFEASPKHSFNLEFPPPAFIGDLEAPVVILMANGGYKAGVTEAEFADEEASLSFAAYLRGERKGPPPQLSQYYLRGRLGRMIGRNEAVLVNAVPYRSGRLSAEPENQVIAKHLSSRRVHRQWLFDEVLPAARNGDRLVFVHRNRWWGIPPSEASEFVVFSDSARAEPNRQAPDEYKLIRAEEWLVRSNWRMAPRE